MEQKAKRDLKHIHGLVLGKIADLSMEHDQLEVEHRKLSRITTCYLCNEILRYQSLAKEIGSQLAALNANFVMESDNQFRRYYFSGVNQQGQRFIVRSRTMDKAEDILNQSGIGATESLKRISTGNAIKIIEEFEPEAVEEKRQYLRSHPDFDGLICIELGKERRLA